MNNQEQIEAIEKLAADLQALCPAPPGANVKAWLVERIKLLREMDRNGEIPAGISVGQMVDDWYMEWVTNQEESNT